MLILLFNQPTGPPPVFVTFGSVLSSITIQSRFSRGGSRVIQPARQECFDLIAGDLLSLEFTTANYTSGQASDADLLPVATANHNGTDDPAFALTVTSLDTGRYDVTGLVPDTYTAGDSVWITVEASVNGVDAKAPIGTFVVDVARWGTVLGAEIPDVDAGDVGGLKTMY